MKKIALLLALVLMVSCFPMAIVAAESKTTENNADDIVMGTTTEKLPQIAGTENLIINGGFEELNENGLPEKWTSRCYNMEDGTGASVVDEAHTGKKAIKLVGGNIPANYPFVQQDFATMGKAIYQMSVWVRKDSGTAPTTVKLEFWPEMLPGASTVMSSNTFSISNTNGQWQEVLFNFLAPFTAKSVSLLARLQNSEGEICYFDDISVYMVRPPESIEITTDANFYYPEQTDGVATASILTNFFPEAIGGSVIFTFLDDGKTVLEEEVQIDENSKAEFHFKTEHLKELKKEYIIHGVLKTAEGEVIAETEEPVYKFNRPKFLKADGTFQADGEEPFFPVMTYHAFGTTFFEPCKEAGINVLQGNAEMLDQAGEYGMKILMVLYPDMKPAGSEENRQITIDLVTKYKDDPRIFAWAVMDEPYLNMPNPHDELRESYRLIRSIDDNHPVFICEASPAHYEEVVKNVDLLCIDPYLPPTTAYANGMMNTTHVYEMTQQAQAASKGLKPIISLLQAFEWYGYLPTGDAERHMIYQTMLAGADAIGYMAISNAMIVNGAKVPIYAVPESDLWEGIVGFGQKEKEDVFKHFILREYGGFNHYIGEDVIYHGYIKDDDVYMIVLNQNIKESVTAEIPLTSHDGKVTIDNYYGEYIYGGEGKGIKGKTNTLKVTLKPHAATVIKVGPLRAVDFSQIDQEGFWHAFDMAAKGVVEEEPVGLHFTDLESHAWASEEIEALYKEGIINEKAEGIFEPATKITRGDFAMFLVNTLRLTAENAEENFADVDPEAEYAKAIAIGKAVGILNGVGDNKYLPEAEITRQDLMTICYRGIQKVKTLEEGEALTEAVFPDWRSVADYAAAAISAMVKHEIVKGNADGTLNPLGNTTRAEAAVIMQRIKNLD